METIAKIRLLHYVEGKGFRAIARDLRLSKNTVKKVIPIIRNKDQFMSAQLLDVKDCIRVGVLTN